MAVRVECIAHKFMKRWEWHETLSFQHTIWRVGECPGNALTKAAFKQAFQKGSLDFPRRHKRKRVQGKGTAGEKAGGTPHFRKEPA